MHLLVRRACAVKGLRVPVGARPTPGRRLYPRKQSKSIGRQQTVESLRCQRAALGRSASLRAITRVNVEQAPKTPVVEADPPPERGRPRRSGRAQPGLAGSTGVRTMARDKGNSQATREIRRGGRLDDQPDARESQAGPRGKSERRVVPRKPGNAGGGKGPHFQRST